MFSPSTLQQRAACAFVSTSLLLTLSAAAAEKKDASASEERLNKGEVVVNLEELAGTKFVVGKILIDESPQKVWPILSNPYEFENKICQRMKRVSVSSDEFTATRMTCRIAVVFPIPDIVYEVESKYTPGERIDFQRTSGSFKDFRGYWKLAAAANGTKTEVTYSIFVDPGLPVPDWIVRQAVKVTLPDMLTGLRDRLDDLKAGSSPEKRTVLAATAYSGIAIQGLTGPKALPPTLQTESLAHQH